MRRNRFIHCNGRGAQNKISPFRLRLKSRKNTALSNPLIAYLQDPDDDNSQLARVAHQKSKESFDPKSFRADLLDRLRRVYYSEPKRDGKPRKHTFYDRLQSYGVLPVFLRTSTLHEIQKWLQLRDIIRTNEELESKKLSVAGYPLRFHSSFTTELTRHENEIAKAISKHNVDKRCLDDYLSGVDREKMRQLRQLCSSRWPGDRGALLETHREEDLAAEIGIFELLRQLFDSALPDRFLRRLTQLVCAPPDVGEIDYNRDEALRTALRRK